MMIQKPIILIDAGTGNLHSVYNALSHLVTRVQVTDNPSDLQPGAKIILPGVGAFGNFMDGLRARGLDDPIKSAILRGDPLLGICVGMQALFEMSEELGIYPGLAVLKGRVIQFPEQPGLKIPHTGWNQLWNLPADPLMRQIPVGSYAYFNHSYYCVPADSTVIASTTDYGIRFASSVHKDNIFGVQFHPEKSQRVGLKLLSNFIEL